MKIAPTLAALGAGALLMTACDASTPAAKPAAATSRSSASSATPTVDTAALKMAAQLKAKKASAAKAAAAKKAAAAEANRAAAKKAAAAKLAHDSKMRAERAAAKKAAHDRVVRAANEAAARKAAAARAAVQPAGTQRLSPNSPVASCPRGTYVWIGFEPEGCRAHKPVVVHHASTPRIPHYGYQCRPGDEKHFKVCAGHNAWVDGQVQFNDCIKAGGRWLIDEQKCSK